MSEYHLLYGQATVNAPPSPTAPPPLMARPQTTGNLPASAHSFQAVMTGVGSVSATIQVYGSNDASGTNWTAYGLPQAISGFGDLQPRPSIAWSGQTPFRSLCAIVTAISGTSAAVYLQMSA